MNMHGSYTYLMYGNTSLLYESSKNCVHTQSVYKGSPQGGGAGDKANIVGAYDIIAALSEGFIQGECRWMDACVLWWTR